MKTFFLLLSLCSVLSGCAMFSSKNNDAELMQEKMASNQQHLDLFLMTKLNQSAGSIDSMVKTLNGYNYMKYPHPDLPLSNVNDALLNQDLLIAWDGPIEGLLSKISKILHYHFQVYGKAPSIPILVSINTSAHSKMGDTSIHVLRNVDVQAQGKARVFVNTEYKVISLRYT